MVTVYLRFIDRDQALAVLAMTFGFDGTQDEDGRQVYSSGLFGEVRYHLCFLSDVGVACGAGQDHVNLLWLGPAEAIPDLGAYTVSPTTPSCAFAD